MDTVRALFKKIDSSPERIRLEEGIFLAVSSLREAQVKRRLRVSYVGLFTSGVAVAGAVFVYGGALLQSEFWSIFTLLFSDMTSVASYFSDYLSLLLETLPVIPAVLMLVPTFAFLVFLGMYSKTVRTQQFSY